MRYITLRSFLIGEKMIKKILLTISVMLVTIIVIIFFRSENIRSREPIIIKGFASIEEVSLDGLISESDLIVIGKVNSNIPSRWNTADGKLPESVTANNISSKYMVITDQMFMPNRIIKGNSDSLIRIRHFGGQVDKDIVSISGEARLELNQSYLLFLFKDTLGSTANINQDHYIVLGSIQGVYKIDNGKAISNRDEWLLEDLIAYIEKSLSGETPLATESPAILDLSTETPLTSTEVPTETPLPAETATSTPQ
jgi:hypothetical protein